MSRVPGIIVAILAGIWVCAQPLPVHARSAGDGAALAAAETSILRTWLRYSATAGSDLTASPLDEAKTARELDRLADRLRPAVAAAKGGPGVVDAFRVVLLEEEGFRYDAVAGNPENFLAGGVISRKRGNCLGLSLLWLSLAERLGVPFRGAYVPGHCFVRYEGKGARVNVEFSDGGAPWEDELYLRKFRLRGHGPYLRSLSAAEMLGVFLKSVGAAYAGKGRHGEALTIYAEAERMYPGLPDAHYNAGVSLQRLGRTDEAIAKYRKALSLDPYMAPARGNLASTYASCGNYDEGISEFLKAVELDPSSAKAREGLTRALFARGDYLEAAMEAERAEALGCRFEPSMLEALDSYRKR
ncbi:MAG: tetratricopeptide repeat protein [Deltaproteobacteria bacterium]|nr:tetratricopeptide repeat protein [Deltaproteobacteria bacterium]